MSIVIVSIIIFWEFYELRFVFKTKSVVIHSITDRRGGEGDADRADSDNVLKVNRTPVYLPRARHSLLPSRNRRNLLRNGSGEGKVVTTEQWQVLESSNGSFYLYGAYLDVRANNRLGPTVRVLGMINRLEPSVKTQCQLWFSEDKPGSEPVVSRVLEYKYIWDKQWGNYKQGREWERGWQPDGRVANHHLAILPSKKNSNVRSFISMV